MDKRKPGRRRSSSEIVTEGKRRKSSSSDLREFRITKVLNAKPEDICVQSSLSKLRSSERWNLPLQELKRTLRNKVISLEHRSKKGVRGHPVTSKASSERQLKVMLTNVLWTDLGRKFRKTLPRNDANLCDATKVHSDSLPSTSVDNLEACQTLEPLHQSLNLSERVSQSSKTVNNNSAQQAVHTKEKQRDDDGISLVMPDTQPKDFNSGSRGCDHLEEGTRNKNDTYSESKVEPTVISRKTKKRLRSNVSDSHSSASSLDASAEQTKEQENDSTVCTEFEKSSEKYHQDPKLLEEITPEPLGSGFTKLSPLSGQELALSAAPKSASDCSASGTFESSASSDAVGTSALAERSESESNTIEKPLRSGHSEGNQSLISAEPIVVSSDEEGPVEHKSSEILKLQPKQDHEIVNENERTCESAMSELPLITCESVQAPSELYPVMEKVSCITPGNAMDLQLDFMFTSVYIGKIKGASKGCVTFTTKYIKIPFQGLKKQKFIVSLFWRL